MKQWASRPETIVHTEREMGVTRGETESPAAVETILVTDQTVRGGTALCPFK